MIARPVHRPRPIPFDTQDTPDARTPGSASGSSRAVSWGNASSSASGIPHMPARLSPVKVSLAAAPVLTTPAQAAHRTLPANAGHVGKPVLPGQGGSSGGHAAAHNVGGPRQHGRALTEISARYIGQGALSVRSSVTGRHYRFQGHGDSLVIDRNDVVLLKRIPDLVIR